MQIPVNLRGIVAMLLSALSFAACDSFLKMILESTAPFQALSMRGLSAVVCCFVLVAVMGQVRQLPKAINFWISLRSLAEVAAVSSFIVALQVVPLADITAIYQVAPLFVLAGASFIWRENVGLLRWVLIVTGLVGALVVAQPGQDGASPLALLGFITAIAAAARDLLSRKVPADTPGLVITFNVIVMVFVMATLYNWLFEGWTPVPLSVWAYGLGAGFFVVLGQLFVFLAFRFAAARSVVPFYYASIVFAAAFGAVFFAEYPNALALSGMAMIIVCGVGVLYFEDGEKQA